MPSTSSRLTGGIKNFLIGKDDESPVAEDMISTFRQSTPPTRLRLRITAAAESIVRSGHPWLFADSIHELNRPGQLGELAVIYDRKDKFLAVGLFDPDSPIRVRILHAGKPATIDAAWWRTRLEQALA